MLFVTISNISASVDNSSSMSVFFQIDHCANPGARGEWAGCSW